MHAADADVDRARLPSALLAASSLLSVVLMAHHPSATSHDMAAALSELAEKAALAKVVHGGLIGLLGVQAFALLELSARLGWQRSTVRAASLAYVVGMLGLIGAAIISGFVLTNLALRFAGTGAGAADPLRYVFGAAALANRSMASFGVVATSIGIALWSCAMARGSRGAKAIAVLGAVAGLVPAAAIILGLLHLDVAGMTVVVVAQAAWNLATAYALARGGILPAR